MQLKYSKNLAWMYQNFCGEKDVIKNKENRAKQKSNLQVLFPNRFLDNTF